MYKYVVASSRISADLLTVDDNMIINNFAKKSFNFIVG